MRHRFYPWFIPTQLIRQQPVTLLAVGAVLAGLLTSDYAPRAIAESSPTSTSTAINPSLLNRTWRLVSWKGQPWDSLGDRSIPTVQFEQQNLSGFGGCNRYRASYRLTQSTKISISPISATRRACTDPKLNRQEQLFLSALEAAETLEQNHRGQLILRSRNSSGKLQKLIFASSVTPKPVETMQSLNGTSWILSTWNQAKPDNLSTQSQPITVAFTENLISGFGGCNRFSGGYRWIGRQLKMSDLIASTIGCEPALMEQETAFFAALSGLQSVEVRDDQLNLTYKTEEGESGILVFNRSNRALDLPDASTPQPGAKEPCVDETGTSGIRADQTTDPVIDSDTVGSQGCG